MMPQVTFAAHSDVRVLSFDMQDEAQIEICRSRGGLPRVSVSAVDGSQEVEFVHTVDSDPLVSIAFFEALIRQSQQAIDELAQLMSAQAASGRSR
jgi:hypothetical protein